MLHFLLLSLCFKVLQSREKTDSNSTNTKEITKSLLLCKLTTLRLVPCVILICMNIVGITTEYNPFHQGHALQLDLVRHFADGIVVVQSGAFCQRGDIAIQDPWSRAEVAVENGADLVLQLPTTVSLRSAEDFAKGAVQSLLGTGIVNQIFCGSEDPRSRELLLRAAQIRRTENSQYRDILQAQLAEGHAWSEASFRALTQCLHLDELEKMSLRRPNNLLAMAYLMELEGTDVELVLHSRRDDNNTKDFEVQGKDFHAFLEVDEPAGLVTSASDLRAKIHEATTMAELVRNVGPYLPQTARERLYRAHHEETLLDNDALLLPALTVLLRAGEEELDDFFPDGLGRRLQAKAKSLIRNLHTFDDPFERLIRKTSSRRYPMNAVRRGLLQFLLDPRAFGKNVEAPFLIVLAYSRQGRYLLRRMRRSATIPILTKFSDLVTLDDKEAAETELKAQRLYRSLAKGKGPEFFTQVPQQLKQAKFKGDPERIQYPED